jgi:hypothetical protein
VNTPSKRNTSFIGNEGETTNSFWQYVQSMSPEAIAQLSKPTSPEVIQMMEHNIVGMLGSLPPDHFDVMITTSREQLGRLLASAMMNGYFLRNAEQRLQFEQTVHAVHAGASTDESAAG